MDEHTPGGRFEAALLAAADDWKAEAGYVWKRLKPMIRAYGAVGMAKRQVVKAGVSAGFVRLQEARRLDLTIEALILRAEFAALFTREERRAARHRLVAHGFGKGPA